MTHNQLDGFSANILQSALCMGAITREEMLTKSVQEVALEKACSHQDDDEIGGSDFHAIVQGFLHSLGKPSIFTNNGVNPYAK